MFEVGVYEAKANFSAIIRRIQQGEACVITQRGKPVVRMESAAHQHKDEIKQSFDRLERSLAKVKLAKNWSDLKATIEEGRK